MGTDFSIRPVGVPVATPVVRPQPDATGGAVPTELPAPKAAAAPTDAAASANNPSPPPEPRLGQNVVVDRGAGTVVYQTINQQTGQVISQSPDDAVLQARAYYRALEELQADSNLYDQTA